VEGSEVRLGIIGCGHWGKNYVRVFDQLPGIHVAQVADRIPENLAYVSERFPRALITDDYETLLADREIDAVVVATDATSHYRIANAAIEAGKHLIVEKPLALDPEECDRLTESAAARDLTLMVGHTFLYNDSVRMVREILQQPETGEVYYLTSRRTHLGKIREDVGALWDLAAHDISIFSYLLGYQPESVCAVGGSYLRDDRDDVAFLTLMYANGVVGNIQVSWVDANKIRELVLITGKRRIEFNDLDNLESVRVFDKGISIEHDVESFGEFQYRLRDGDIRSPRVERREPLLTLCQHFIECVREGLRPRSDGANGAEVVRVLRAASESMGQGGVQVKV
jgi:predicted dehydrogenase